MGRLDVLVSVAPQFACRSRINAKCRVVVECFLGTERRNSSAEETRLGQILISKLSFQIVVTSASAR